MKIYVISIFILLVTFSSCNPQEAESNRSSQDQKVINTEEAPQLQIPQTDTITRPIEGFNWLDFSYDEARIYLYGVRPSEIESEGDLIINNGKLNSTVFDQEGKLLTDEQVTLINNILSGKYHSGDDEQSADCFFPHHGIVFYKSQKPVAHISICIMCHQLTSSPKQGYFDSDMLSKLIKELNLPIFDNPFEAMEYGKNID